MAITKRKPKAPPKLFDANESAESMQGGRASGKKQRPVSGDLAKIIVSLKEACKEEFGADFTIHIEAQGQRVADYSMVLGWLPPKEI